MKGFKKGIKFSEEHKRKISIAKLKGKILALKDEYKRKLEEYEKEYKYAESENIEYWEGAIHSVEEIIKDLGELLK